jgi:hypothetical protein
LFKLLEGVHLGFELLNHFSLVGSIRRIGCGRAVQVDRVLGLVVKKLNFIL